MQRVEYRAADKSDIPSYSGPLHLFDAEAASKMIRDVLLVRRRDGSVNEEETARRVGDYNPHANVSMGKSVRGTHEFSVPVVPSLAPDGLNWVPAEAGVLPYET